MEGMNFAAIDIGTNAARLLIKNIDHNPLGETKFRKVLFIRYPLRLGMDVFSKGKIGKERAEMMMRMIKGFKQMMRMYDVVDYRACATSAMRDAKNGKALIKKIEKKTGIRIDLIEGKERKGLKVTVKLTETDIVENIIRMLKQVALDERIDKNIRDEYLADLSEQIGFDIVINDKPTDFKLDKNTHDNIMQKFTKVV